MVRRTFIKKTLYSTLGLSSLTGFYTWQIKPFWLEFVKRKLPIANLPDHLIGKSLMQIRDDGLVWAVTDKGFFVFR